jgi:hypothetical protein
MAFSVELCDQSSMSFNGADLAHNAHAKLPALKHENPGRRRRCLVNLRCLGFWIGNRVIAHFLWIVDAVL